MIARGIHHVSFAVRDLERSRRFYEGVLELEAIPRPELGVAGMWYRAGASEVHLIETPPGADVGAAPGRLSPLANHSAFAIADYGATLARLKARGVEVLETNPERGQLWVRDPDGNVLELIVPATPGGGA
jgi:catechol 2,3-dioxygenase-like lactoylglutathione lyase family enzyme